MNPVIIGNATRETRIYALCEFPSQQPRYVGKTVKSLMGRLKSHMQVALKNPRLPVGHWLAKRERESVQICIKWLETVPAGEDWAARECHWISHFRAQGESMLNLTDGGEGLAGHVFSMEHREKIASALRTGAECSCQHCGATFWRKKNQIQKGEAKYCSKACYGIAQVGKPKSGLGAPFAAIAAAAKSKRAITHCKRGHLLSGENLFLTSIGGRGCKQCRKLHKATYIAGLK